MSGEVRLKPCPFCGGKADYQAYRTGQYVQCRKCKATSDIFNHNDFWEINRIAAAEAWNRRYIPNDKEEEKPCLNDG